MSNEKWVVIHMGRNRRVSCTTCGKHMRSDHLHNHEKVHFKAMKKNLLIEADEIGHEIQQSTSSENEKKRELNGKSDNDAEIPDIDALRCDLLKGKKLYQDKIEMGAQISLIIEEDDIDEESLTKEQKEVLSLHRKRIPRFDFTTTELRTWQQQTMIFFDFPSERTVIWITGNKGNEGKSWFQSYVHAYYGFNRVARVDLRIKHANICNVLKKRTLGSIDIFLFNDARSVSGEDHNLYRILEDIKDGQATASKYDNDNIRFKTPNIVLVFSNQYPITSKLSRDRWKIFHIKNSELHDARSICLK